MRQSIMTLMTKDDSSAEFRKDVDVSSLSATSRTTTPNTSSSFEEDIWNLDLDDVMAAVAPFEPNPRERSKSFRVDRTRESNSKGRSPPKRSVSFDKVQVRVFERVLGVNPPACGKGPSMGLGWSYNEKKAVDLEKFETRRESLFQWSAHRRNSRDLIMSPEQRERMARKLGFSDMDIQTNAQKIGKIVKQRKKTVDSLENKPVDQSDALAIMQRARFMHGFKVK